MKSSESILAPIEAQSQQAPTERRWLTVAEVAKFLDCHPISIYRLCSRRALPHAKAAGVGIRIDRKDLECYLDNARVPAARKPKF
jgi:excisionase family DNA binding protein